MESIARLRRIIFQIHLAFFINIFFFRIELLNVQRTAKEEKKQLKRLIKEKELKFLQENGRPMPKDDIKEQEIYGKYKMVKAKIKLVDALLSKKM